MASAVEQLVRETMELTGATAPSLLAPDAPVLAAEAIAADGDGAVDDSSDFYLVGLIGGKDVGKSALVNALVGRSITSITSHGPGTEGVIAYAHASREDALRRLLEREVPGEYQIVTHDLDHLRRQVLLDLPDIDSHWQSHLLVTRKMLRHMLYPIWVQSIEKYADQQPQQMLRQVAEGNAAANFLFCLNKVDQIRGQRSEVRGQGESAAGQRPASRDREVSDAAREIGNDFSLRIARTIGLAEAPDVFLISALHADAYDLPRLLKTLTREKTSDVVDRSKSLARRQQDRSLLSWVDAQGLDERADRLTRLADDARDLIASRVGQPVIEVAIPRLLDDPASRLAMGDEVLRRRVERWPLVKLVHTLLSPVLSVWRANVGAGGRAGSLRGADALVEAYLEADGRAVGDQVRSSFAQLRQAHPDEIASLYAGNHLWSDLASDDAASQLRRALATAVDRQREYACDRLAGRGGVIAPLVRWVLTVGALLWFPLVQPILSAFLNAPELAHNWRQLAGMIVSVLSGESLLKNVSFLIIWFTVIWLSLRWNTQRRLTRLTSRWKKGDYTDDAMNLPAVVLQWMQELLSPIEQSRDRMLAVVKRTQELRSRAA